MKLFIAALALASVSVVGCSQDTTPTVTAASSPVAVVNDLTPHKIPPVAEKPKPKPKPVVTQRKAKSQNVTKHTSTRASRSKRSTVLTTGSVWDRLAVCESGGNWSINTGNGYYGGLQFSLQTWRAFGGTGMPHHASRATQISIAQNVKASQGWGAWPACSRKLGLR